MQKTLRIGTQPYFENVNNPLAERNCSEEYCRDGADAPPQPDLGHRLERAVAHFVF